MDNVIFAWSAVANCAVDWLPAIAVRVTLLFVESPVYRYGDRNSRDSAVVSKFSTGVLAAAAALDPVICQRVA